MGNHDSYSDKFNGLSRLGGRCCRSFQRLIDMQ